MILSQLFLFIVLVIFPAAFSSPTDFVATFRQFEQYEKDLNKKTTLNYGDRCHAEEVRTMEILKTSLDKLPEIPVASLSLLAAEYEKMNKAMKHLLSTGYDICNDEKLLTCDKTTHRCSCGVTESVLNQKFSFVQNSNGGCHFAKDSSCLPINDTPGKQDTCAGDTSCILINNKGEKLDCDEPNYSDGFSVDDKLKFPHCKCRRT